MKTSLSPTASLGRLHVFALGLALSSASFADPLITDVTLTDTQVILTFEEDGPNNQFQIQRNPNLDPTNWSTDASASLSPLVNGVRTYTISRSAAGKEFYRVIGSFLGTGVDPDGDGLPTTLENSFASDTNSPEYSNPSLFDTDGDGFSDGVEFTNGTEPNNANDKPVFLSVPAVQFAEPNSSFLEGSAATLNIALELDQPYSGNIAYSVNDRSTATTPSDFAALSGTVAVNGTSANIAVSVVDDLIISPEQKLLVITLDPVSQGAGYRLAGGSLHVACLCDNDGYWSAVMKDDIFENDFRVRVLRQGATTQIALVAGSSDGLPIIDEGTSSQSAGVVPTSPVEVWPVASLTDNAATFSFTSSPLPVAVSTFAGFNGSSARVTEEELTRTIRFTCQQSNPDHLFSPQTQYFAEFTEEINPVDSSKSYLQRSSTGVMMMVKDIQPAPNPTNPLDPRLP